MMKRGEMIHTYSKWLQPNKEIRWTADVQEFVRIQCEFMLKCGAKNRNGFICVDQERFDINGFRDL